MTNAYDLYLYMEDGLPMPDRVAIERDAATENGETLRREVARRWVEQFRALAETSYETGESETFVVLTPKGVFAADRATARCEAIWREITNRLPASLKLPKTIVILVPGNSADFYSIVSAHFGPSDHGSVGGFMADRGVTTVVVSGVSEKRRDLAPFCEATIVHELTHAAVASLPIPDWLNEGLAETMKATAFTDSARPLSNGAEILENAATWREHGIRSFWSGRGFHCPDARQTASYSLARTLVHRLFDKHSERFSEFLLTASRVDAGNAAARSLFGKSLGRLVADILGPGDWEVVVEDSTMIPADTRDEVTQRLCSLLNDPMNVTNWNEIMRLAEAAGGTAWKARVFRIRSWVLIKKAKFGAAIADGRMAVNIDVDDPWNHIALGQALAAAGRFPEAIDELQYAIDLSEESPLPMAAQARVLWASGERDRALSLWRRAEAARHDLRQTLYYRGIALMTIGRWADAIVDFDRALGCGGELATLMDIRFHRAFAECRRQGTSVINSDILASIASDAVDRQTKRYYRSMVIFLTEGRDAAATFVGPAPILCDKADNRARIFEFVMQNEAKT